MFGLHHFILIGISVLLIVLFTLYIRKKNISLEKVLSAACVICILSEVTKIFSTLQTVPSSDGSMMYLYLDVKQLPLHLCSIQIILIFIVRFTKNINLREKLLAFIYPTGVLGGLFAIVLPTYLNGMTPLEIFTSPRMYQYFLFHIMLVTLGIYIAASGCVRFHIRHLFSSLGILALFALGSLYLNSMFASPVYKSGQLVSMEYMPNYFFTQEVPIHFPLTEKWHWFAWWGIMLLLAVILFSLCFLPVILRDRKRL
ncbi:MAG: YwaF family protein [Clostridia bacterium]|nr:YwaF family protein [Clostridia bacterium]